MNILFLAQSVPDATAHAGAVGIAGFGIVLIALAVVTSLFWIWMLVDCATNRAIDGMQKIVWILVILCLHVLGALIYFLVGRRPAKSFTPV